MVVKLISYSALAAAHFCECVSHQSIVQFIVAVAYLLLAAVHLAEIFPSSDGGVAGLEADRSPQRAPDQESGQVQRSATMMALHACGSPP